MEGNRKPTASLQTWGKALTAVLLIALFTAAVWWLFRSPAGFEMRHDPEGYLRSAHRRIHHYVHQHELTAPLVYLAVYILFAVLALPIWWLQLLGGIGFGLYEGTFLSVIGSTAGAGLAAAVLRWMAGDWFHQRVESQMARLKKLDEILGHNGFLFVMTARLIPLVPFGLFNYALGLSKLSYRDIILGTFLGAIPHATVYVALGAGYNPHDWIFDLAISGLTLVLLSPLGLRYLKPRWFERIGVE